MVYRIAEAAAGWIAQLPHIHGASFAAVGAEQILGHQHPLAGDLAVVWFARTQAADRWIEARHIAAHQHMGFAQVWLAAHGPHGGVLAAAAQAIEHVLAQQLADAIAVGDHLHVVALGPQAGCTPGWAAVDFQQKAIKAGADAVVGAGTGQFNQQR